MISFEGFHYICSSFKTHSSVVQLQKKICLLWWRLLEFVLIKYYIPCNILPWRKGSVLQILKFPKWACRALFILWDFSIMNSALKCFARVQLLGLSYYCQVHRALILFPFFGSSEVCLCSLGHQPASSPTPPAQERNPAKPTTVGRIQEVQEGSDGLSCVLMLEADCRHEWLLLP